MTWRGVPGRGRKGRLRLPWGSNSKAVCDGKDFIKQIPLYPLRFDPIYQYRLWGGRRLAELLAAPLPGEGPIGEAWLLSDRDDHSSKVADGPLQDSTIRQLMERMPEQMLGNLAGRFKRFPVLLKF